MNKKSASLRDGLEAIIQTGALKNPEVISVVFSDDQNELVVRATDSKIEHRLLNFNVFFLELRRKVRQLTGNQDWGIRYASQVTHPLIPMLHSNRDLKVIIDPLMPYRNPIRHMGLGNEIRLYVMPSNAYYFHSRDVLATLKLPHFVKYTHPEKTQTKTGHTDDQEDPNEFGKAG